MHTIDTWLERKEPMLGVVDSTTGEEMILWSENTLRETRERGGLLFLDPGDFSLNLFVGPGLTRGLAQ